MEGWLFAGSIGTNSHTYTVTEGFSSSRTTSSYSSHDCFRELDPGEVSGLWKRMLVEADDTVELETVLSRREELLAHSWISCDTNWLMAVL